MPHSIVGSLRAYFALVRQHGIGPATKFHAAGCLRWQRPVLVRVCNETIAVRPNSPDLLVAHSTLTDEFQPLEGLLPRDFDGLVLDAGGYIGTAAIKLARMYPRSTVVTIEPSDENFEILLRNTRTLSNIVPLKAALVADRRRNAQLSDRGTGAWGYTIVEGALDNPAAGFLQKVDTITLRDIVQRHGGTRIGLAKIDIEGAERELFLKPGSGLEEIPAIFVELHDRIVSGCTDAFDKFSVNRQVSRFGGEKYLSVAR